MAKVAFYTIGLLQAQRGDPQVQGFFDRTILNFQAAEASPGFIDRARNYGAPTERDPWGRHSTPTIFAGEVFDDMTPQTLTLWADLESVFAFSYNGIHAEALSKRKEWFTHPEWPSYVAWWVADNHTPTWEEAYERYDRLHRNGASYEAFDFKHPFGPDGQPVTIDRAAVRKIAPPRYKRK